MIGGHISSFPRREGRLTGHQGFGQSVEGMNSPYRQDQKKKRQTNVLTPPPSLPRLAAEFNQPTVLAPPAQPTLETPPPSPLPTTPAMYQPSKENQFTQSFSQYSPLAQSIGTTKIWGKTTKLILTYFTIAILLMSLSTLVTVLLSDYMNRSGQIFLLILPLAFLIPIAASTILTQKAILIDWETGEVQLGAGEVRPITDIQWVKIEEKKKRLLTPKTVTVQVGYSKYNYSEHLCSRPLHTLLRSEVHSLQKLIQASGLPELANNPQATPAQGKFNPEKQVASHGSYKETALKQLQQMLDNEVPFITG